MRSLSLTLLCILPLAALADVVVPADRVENSVNIRLEKDATSEVVGKLKKGESLPHVSSDADWHEVRLEGDRTGYVSADWAVVRADEPEVVDELPAEELVEAVVEEGVAETLEAAVAEEVEEVVEAAAEEEVEEVVEAAVEEVVEEVVEDAVAEEVEEAVEAAIEDEAEVAVETAIQDEAEEVVAADDAVVTAEAEAEVAVEPVADPIVVTGPQGPPGPPGPPGAATIKGSDNFVVKFRGPTEGGNSQIFDNGNQVGIGTTEPKQRLEVNGNIQIHEQNSSVAGLMITQSSGETGYVMHNRASTLTIGAGSQDRITIDRNGNVGIGVARPEHPLEMANGAHVTAGGVWTNRSSRADKQNISQLTADVAMAALQQLDPVVFNYRGEPEEQYAGFIAEDVPDIVASRDRQSLSAMDVVAVLTRVVQQQQQKIEELEARLDAPD